MMSHSEEKYGQVLSGTLQVSPRQIFFYWKGRVALYALLKAIGVGKDDEVILPAYTCVVVPNAIKYLGATPVYVDITTETYTMNVDLLSAAITPHTKVIICQNTYGMSSQVEELLHIARRHNLYTIEDCTHGFGGYYHGKPNGSFCDASFFSTQWNKPFSTGIGGFACVNNTELLDSLLNVNKDLISTSCKDQLSLKILYFVRKKLFIKKMYWTLLKTYRFLSRFNIVQGSSSGIELEGTTPPPHYFKALSKAQVKEGLCNLKKLPDMILLRKKNAAQYTHYLEEHGKNHVDEALFANHAFLKYPCLVNHRDEVFRLAEEKHVALGEWFISPLHPVAGDLQRWNFDEKAFPNALFAAAHVINLPTDEQDITAILSFLDSIQKYIL